MLHISVENKYTRMKRIVMYKLNEKKKILIFYLQAHLIVPFSDFIFVNTYLIFLVFNCKAFLSRLINMHFLRIEK